MVMRRFGEWVSVNLCTISNSYLYMSKEDYVNKRDKRMIFLGNGDHSGAECYRLHKDLEEALTILSGIQQSAFEDNIEEKHELTELAHSIYIRLTGHKIVKTEEVPIE